MRHDSKRWWTSFAFAAAIGAPTVAEAGEVSVTLVEDHGGVTVRIRGVGAGADADHIVTSKTGALLFVPGDEATAQRLRPLERHRLDYVQIGRAGQRVAVRVVQRKRAKGTLSKHMRTAAVAGGFDVRIEDATTTAIPGAPAPAAVVDRTAALSRIAGDAPIVPVAAAVTPTVAPPVIAAVTPTPAPVAAALAPSSEPLAATPVEPTAADDRDADAGTRWAAATSQQAPLDLGRSAPQIGLAWLATAMLAFSGLGLLWWRRRRPTLDTPQPLRVLARVGIGPKQQIVWISAGGRALLIGATEQRIDLLADLTASPAMAPIAAAAAAEMQPAAPAPDGRIAAFKQRLRVALGDELAGRNEEPVLPPHLEMLSGDPRWVGHREAT